MVSNRTRRVYSEVDKFLSSLDEEYLNKIPPKIISVIKSEKDPNYLKDFDSNLIGEFDFSKEALAIVSYLYLQFWCKDQKEKEELIKIYKDNDDKYNNEMRKKFSF